MLDAILAIVHLYFLQDGRRADLATEFGPAVL